MDDLVVWLRTQLDEDERAAEGASWHPDAGTWTAKQSEYGPKPGRQEPRWFILDSMDDGVITDVDAEASQPDGVAKHIALHDPARVLREIDAKRRLLAVHRRYVPQPGQACLGCAGGVDFERCPVVRLLALPYADRPGYREEWRP